MMLFPTHICGGGVDAQQERQYDVAPDGRFLINLELESAAAPITLLMTGRPRRRTSFAEDYSSVVAICRGSALCSDQIVLRRCTLLNAARLWIAFNTNSLQPYQRDPFGRLGASRPPTSCCHSLKAMRSSTRLNLRGAVEQELRRVRQVYSFSKCLEAPVEAYP